jgi:hypothetical protein
MPSKRVVEAGGYILLYIQLRVVSAVKVVCPAERRSEAERQLRVQIAIRKRVAGHIDFRM